ncbi:MAG: lipid-A-disaccharide synthase [Kiritimatiellaeota bacterium]|nr:lipid-A-disaccharide synthase [Kiritimatiellota bacterium]
MSRSVLVIAGEVSGDQRAAEVIRAVRSRQPDVQFWGIGGPEMRAAGAETTHDIREMAVMGLVEVLRRYTFFRRVFNEMIAAAEARRPDAVLLVDYPGFNLRFAAQMKQRGIKVIYYICPQVWAWHRSRIPKMAQIVDRLLAIFPFEPQVFAGTGLKVDFVGHPLVDAAQAARTTLPQPLPWQGDPRIALLPGSRRQEIERILPSIWQAAALIQKQKPEASFILAAPSEAVAKMVRAKLAELDAGPARCALVVDQTREVLRQARAALVASGTATLETALMNCPMLVVYKTSLPTYLIGRQLISVSHIGMVNLIAGRTICPEFIQHDATPEKLAAGLLPLLGATPERAVQLAGLAEVAAELGAPGAATRAAAILLAELGL